MTIVISTVFVFVLLSMYPDCFGVDYGICLRVLKWLKHEADKFLLLSTEDLLFMCAC